MDELIAALQDAETAAREAGLLGDDDAEAAEDAEGAWT